RLPSRPLPSFPTRRSSDLAKTLLDRTGALAEHPGGVGARPRRAVLDAPPLVGAGRVADPLTLLGHALRQAGGLAAQALGPSTVADRKSTRLNSSHLVISYA